MLEPTTSSSLSPHGMISLLHERDVRGEDGGGYDENMEKRNHDDDGYLLKERQHKQDTGTVVPHIRHKGVSH